MGVSRTELSEYMTGFFSDYKPEGRREDVVRVLAEAACDHFDGRDKKGEVPNFYYNVADSVWFMQADHSNTPIPAGVGMWLVNQADSGYF